VAIARFDLLHGVADGQEVEIAGRYERWSPDLAAPGQVPVTARVVLDDGIGVLIGRYREPESRRPDDELVRLTGARVRVAGRFSSGRGFPGPGPMPGLWTGGGPQIVEVALVEMLEAAVIEAPRARTPPVVRHPPQAPSPPSPPPAVLPLPAPPPARLAVGAVARRSLAGGRSRMVIAAPLVAFVVAGGCIALAILALHLAVPRRYVVPVVFIGGAVAFLATRLALVRLLAARELRRVAALPWPFDVASYLAQLEGERIHSSLRIDIELSAPVADSARASLFDARRLGRATIGWPHAHVVSIQCPSVRTDLSSDWAYKPRYDNARIHRWFRRCELAAIQPLAAAGRIRVVAAHIAP
jgi:hypothetical protein